jgi:hypothetical protein
MSNRRIGVRRGSIFGQGTRADRRGRKARRLTLDPVFLEDRTLLATLAQVIEAYDMGVAQLYGHDGQEAISLAAAALDQSLPLVQAPTQALSDLLQSAGDDVGGILADAFQNVIDLEGLTWNTLFNTLQAPGTGISIAYPSSAPASSDPTAATSGPYQGDYLALVWQPPAGLVNTTTSLNVNLADFGDTGFSYLDGGDSDSLSGALSGSIGQITAQVIMGVDDSSAGGPPVFFLDVNPADTYVTVPNITASGSVTGSASIGNLANVTIAGTVSLNIASASVNFTTAETDQKLHITSSTTSIATVGNVNGSVQLGASLDAEVPPLGQIPWSATFVDNIVNGKVGSPTYQLHEPSASTILSGLAAQFLGSLSDFSLLGSLETELDKPLPLLGESIAEITGLDVHLPKIPSLGDLGLASIDPSNVIGTLEQSLGIQVNDGNISDAALATMMDNLLHGQQVDLLSWSTSGTVPPSRLFRDNSHHQPRGARYHQCRHRRDLRRQRRPELSGRIRDRHQRILDRAGNGHQHELRCIGGYRGGCGGLRNPPGQRRRQHRHATEPVREPGSRPQLQYPGPRLHERPARVRTQPRPRFSGRAQRKYHRKHHRNGVCRDQLAVLPLWRVLGSEYPCIQRSNPVCVARQQLGRR